MKIDDEKQTALVAALRNGSDLETACHYAGLSTQQVLRTLEVGKLEAERVANGMEADAKLSGELAIWEALKKARAEAIVRNVTYIQKAASDGSWQAAAWWLERAVPETYSKKTAKPAPVESTEVKQLETQKES